MVFSSFYYVFQAALAGSSARQTLPFTVALEVACQGLVGGGVHVGG
jgi:hypothetical protein